MSDSRQVLEELARVVETHSSRYGPRVHARVLDLCAESMAFAQESEPPEVGTRARSSAYLLLELVCPYLGEESITALSVACERAAVRLL